MYLDRTILPFVLMLAVPLVSHAAVGTETTPSTSEAAAERTGATTRDSLQAWQSDIPAREAATAQRYGLSDFDAGRLVGRTIVVTASFAAICTGILLGIRQLRKHGALKGGTSEMKVLETLTVGPRCVLQLVQVERQRFLVARDAHGMRSVTPVQSFVETLDDVSEPMEDPVVRQPLTSASTFGLSLEGPVAAEWSTRETSGRRSDPWQTR